MANHLNVDTATIEGGTGAWVNWFSTTVSQSADHAFEGTKSLKILVSTAGTWGVTFNNWPGFAATAGEKTIRLRARQGVNISSGTFKVKWRDSANSDILVTDLAVSALDGTYKLFSTTATAPAGTTSVYVEFTGPSAALNDTVYIDDIYIGDLESAAQPSGTALVTGTGEVSASGSRTAVSSVSVGGTGQAGVQASRGALVASSVEGAGAVLATGSKHVSGVASVTGTGAVGASGSKQTTTTSSVTGTGSVTASGTASVPFTGSGVALVAGTGAVSVTGGKHVAGSASVIGTGSVVAAGSKGVTRFGSVSGAGSVLVVGTKSYATSSSVVGTGSVSVESLVSRGGTASVQALGLVAVTAGSLRPEPAGVSVSLASPQASVMLARDGATVTASKPAATTSSSAPTSS